MSRTPKIKPLKPFGLEIHAPTNRIEDFISTAQLQDLVRREKLVVIRGLPAMERDVFLSFCQGFEDRSILEWNFGAVMELREDPDPKNYIFSSEKVPFHWDGAFAVTPSLLVFSCIDVPNTERGGETLFCDTEAILRDASPSEREVFDRAILRFETEKRAHYGGEIEGSLVRRHPESGRMTLRYSEPVETKLNPVSLTIKGVSAAEAEWLALHLRSQVYDERYCYTHQWQRGDFLIADNHSLLHGRRAFQSGSGRQIRRIQLV